MTLLERLKDVIVQLELVVITKQQELSWVRMRKAQVDIAGDNPELLERLTQDIPNREMEIEGLNFAITYYRQEVAKLEETANDKARV